MLPRIRGKVGEFIENGKDTGKFGFEIWISEFGGGEAKESDSLGCFGPFDTEEQAHQELKNACKMACETYAQNTPGADPNSFVDMKTNKTMNWK